MKYQITNRELGKIVAAAIEDCFCAVQEKLRITQGDIAGQFASGNADMGQLEIDMVKLMQRYVAFENLHAEEAN